MKSAGRQIAIIALAMAILVASAPETVRATSTQEKLNQAKQEKKQTEDALKKTQQHIEGMQGTQNSLQGRLAKLNDDLTQVSENLSILEERTDAKEQEISDTEAALDEAQKKVEWQYECMKKRIKFIYERSDAVYMELLFSSKGIGDFLNKTEYIERISEYDQRMLQEYRDMQAQIKETKSLLESEKQDLDQLKADAEVEQAKVSGMVKNMADNIAGYADQIAQAENVANAYQEQMKQQEANIAALQKQLAEEQAKSRLAAQSEWRDISEVTFAEGDRELLAQLIYCEAGGEPYAGKVAVGAVVINRVLSSVYPDTIVGVIYQRRQFEPVATGRLALALSQGKATPACYQAADEAMAGNTNVGNCVYFRTPIPGLTGISIGGHIFY